ncbi:MAG TPA: hypothetical protein EYN38_10855 [Flavobacteriales bacterium]|nr:hypothetical protein [Flavobacteriales bacterium]
MAKRNALEGTENPMAISNTSGGIGKKDASIKAKMNRARSPFGFSEKDSTQSLSCFNHLNNIKSFSLAMN